MTADLHAADRFLQAESRLLERRLFDVLIRDASPDPVVDVLRGYRNADGGFGHGLEPDKRCPASLPIDVEVAFQALVAAGVTDHSLLGPACDFLGTLTVDGAVPLATPAIEDYPRAAHWTEWTYAPGLNPTAGLAGLLHRLGFAHPWRDAATAYCWREIESGKLPDEVHALGEAMTFLAYVPDRARAERAAVTVLEQLTASPMFDPEPGEYGLTPLHIAATGDSPWRGLFASEKLEAELDRLAAGQQDDGGWTVTWEPPSEASRLEWRGVVTVQAVRTLRSYGRIGG